MSEQSNSRGVFYIAFGESYRLECAKSIQSLRRFHPELNICVVTDRPWNHQPQPEIVEIRDSILSLKSKPTYLKESPFDETLYLDTDTRIVGPISAVFDLLEFFDIGVSFRPQFLRCEPYFVPWCNSGVLLYKNNQSVQRTLFHWLQMYVAAEKERPEGRILDDRFLPIAIARNDARVVHLASPLNFFLGEPQMTCSPIRIIHTRNEAAYRQAVKVLSDWNPDADWGSRIWIPQLNGFFPKGGLRFPGMWKNDPLIALSILIRRVVQMLRRLANPN